VCSSPSTRYGRRRAAQSGDLCGTVLYTSHSGRAAVITPSRVPDSFVDGGEPPKRLVGILDDDAAAHVSSFFEYLEQLDAGQ
jgi:hypothetical protein